MPRRARTTVAAARVSAAARRDGKAAVDSGVDMRRQPLDALQHRQRFFRPRAALDRRGQQAPGVVGVAAGERGGPGLEQLFPFALPFGDGAARPLDVGAGPRVAAVQEQDPRPDTDCQFVLSAEIMVEAGEEQLLDSRFTSGVTSTYLDREADPPSGRCAAIIHAPMPIIECIPNVSEGRRPEVIDAIAAAIRAMPGVRLLDYSSDAVAQPLGVHLRRRRQAVKAAVLAMYERAVPAIDLRAALRRASAPRRGRRRAVRPDRRRHDGRVRGAGQGRRAPKWPSRFGVPVYLYEEASSNPARKNLEDIRRGEFEGLAAKMASAGLGARLRSGGAAPVAPAHRSSARACRSSPTTST